MPSSRVLNALRLGLGSPPNTMIDSIGSDGLTPLALSAICGKRYAVGGGGGGDTPWRSRDTLTLCSSASQWSPSSHSFFSCCHYCNAIYSCVRACFETTHSYDSNFALLWPAQ